MKVSFDFDDTLSKPAVQSFAKWLADRGADVWVVTSRYSDEYWANKNPKNWTPNSDLWNVVAELELNRNNVHFTGLAPKWTFFRDNPDFVFHLDNDPDENREINENCSVPCVDVRGGFWMKQCKEHIKRFIKNKRK